MISIKKIFGNNLRNIRKIKNLTQEELSEKLGINTRQLARIELGESFVTAETLYNICVVLDIEPKILFDINDNEEVLLTGTDNKAKFKVVKNSNVIQLLNIKSENEVLSDDNDKDFDKRMLRVAKNIGKNIIVDKLEDNVVFQTKIYKNTGQIEIIDRVNLNHEYECLLDNIKSFKNDSNKIQFLNLALDALSNKSSLEELKSVIKGIELKMNDY